ncbi:MAG: SHOCT domain-containing protein [Roseovarius sp.]|jgi:putative membrane protein|nr:SHOCT domain-containing protein [Roseovarius sp.]
MVLGPIFMILILVGIVVGVIYVLRLFGVAGSSQPAHDRALMLLKERYAKGEIDTKEFEERKKLLTH